MTVGPGDGLFGQDGTGDAIGGVGPADGVGPLPGLELPVLRLPAIGLDGEITGLDEFDADLEKGSVGHRGAPAPGTRPFAESSAPSQPDRYARPRPAPTARPRVVDEPGILGLSRRARSRVGSRLFTLFFVLVFALILVQMVVALLEH